jgi:hypothetical protein
MKKRRLYLMYIAVLVCLTSLSMVAWAAQSPNAGNGGGNGSGNESESGNSPPDYGDLFVLHRDMEGIPILTEELCQQPIAAASFTGCINVPAGEGVNEDQCLLIPVDPATCTVLPEYAIYTQEVEFGRISVARAPETVLESQLEDALLNLSTAGCTSLDPAGRLVYSSNVDENLTTSSSIDSPLQNLAIYRQLMLTGTLGENVTLPGNNHWLNTAARGLGAAVDKTGKVTVDMVVYLNQILGLTDKETITALPKTCIDVREEVKGVMQTVEKCFLQYSDYNYTRASNFASLPHPAYIPAYVSGPPVEGNFEYLSEMGETRTFEISQGPIMGAVPELKASPGYSQSDIGAFVQAADDTRAVIEFMHSWPVPGDYATPVTCGAGSDVYYDVSISDKSGLQVPVRMVAGTEGREGTVTIANAGPAVASGTVMVTGRYTINGQEHTVLLYRMNAAGEPTNEPIFNTAAEPFEGLLADRTQTWSFFFSMSSTATINWTATVTAVNDVNLANNTVTQQTIVTRSTGGGSGSSRR